MLIAKKPHLLTVAGYMTLQTDGRTELLGIIYDVSPKNEPHSLAVRRLTKALARGLGAQYAVSVQGPIRKRLDRHERARDRCCRHRREIYSTTPTAADAFAFIEVSDPT